ncbi:class I SAM-dependent methyltransferase [Methanobacterium petrolearium]|uniref:class I SAM-dependent methyltransferase n=1 Tax=Methanobacterium petrolearium TaxID=710190 RepID=UPI001AE502B3|nr:class I SAM-dependent methyltransferase [Methanobacterium petrolearium]MBP1946540.1 2-polyprenyl-3-methyl-5-hydroxy-6-metoxy-1,4-benzoquinol methylase [Methanobacterium petrolearium]BDZ69885.1 hypothetical protein GCM10025861_04020 [Methanobacterium petrolearium]
MSEKIWNLMANNYDKSEEPFTKIHITNLKKTKKYLNNCDMVLDLGCGTGTQALEIASDVKEVHGIDTSSKMIEIAKRKAHDRKTPNAHFRQATIFDERLLKESFDVILAFNILNYLEDTPEVMQRINELLKPGGFFISSTECMGEEEKKFSRILSFSALFIMEKARVISTKFYKFFELEDLIYNGNFQIVETEKLKLRHLKFYFIVAKKI